MKKEVFKTIKSVALDIRAKVFGGYFINRALPKRLMSRGKFLFTIVALMAPAQFSACNNELPKDIFDMMSITEYRELNKMLTEVNEFPGLSEMANEENLILFGAYVAMYIGGEWCEEGEGSKEAVEAILNRYFGVEKIYHEKSDLYRSWPGSDVDYPIDGVGGIGIGWANATKFHDAENGIIRAEVDLYYSFGEYWNDSFLEPVSQWKLKKGAKIINTDLDTLWNDEERDFESDDIYRYESCMVTLKPFVYKGKDTWQIIGINGVDVPKILFP